MKQFLKLTIPEPCSQAWNEMSRNESGRFCDSCNKCVIDFTSFSDQQLKDYFIKRPQNVCGNFSPDQLNRFLIAHNYANRGNFIPQLLVSAALTFGLSSKVDAKEFPYQTFQVQTDSIPQHQDKLLPTSSTDSMSFISGKILDFEKKEPIAFVIISVKGIKQNVISDTAGNFKIVVPDTSIGKEITLLFAFVGYETKEIQLSFLALPVKTEVYLTKNNLNIRGAVASTSYFVDGIKIKEKSSLWHRMFHRKTKESGFK